MSDTKLLTVQGLRVPRELVEILQHLRGQQSDLYEHLLAALTVSSGLMAHDMLAATPETLPIAQGRAQAINALLILARDPDGAASRMGLRGLL